MLAERLSRCNSGHGSGLGRSLTDATRAELQSIADQTTDRTAYLRLAETLTAFLARLRSSAETLDIIER
jgi:site-specific DNA recombinase